VEAPDDCLSKSKVIAHVNYSSSIIALWGILEGHLLDEHDSDRANALLRGIFGDDAKFMRVKCDKSENTGPTTFSLFPVPSQNVHPPLQENVLNELTNDEARMVVKELGEDGVV